MAQQTIGIGTAANDGTGDPLRTAFTKTNDNFDELYDKVFSLAISHTYIAEGDETPLVIGTANTPTKYQLPVTIRQINNFAIQEISGQPGVYALHYTGTRNVTMSLMATSSLTCTVNNTSVKLMMYKNGTIATGATIQSKVVNSTDVKTLSIATSFNASTGDYFDVYVEADATCSITFKYTNIVIHEV